MLAPTIEPHASTGRMTSATRARQIFASVTKSSICTTPYRWPSCRPRFSSRRRSRHPCNWPIRY